MAGLTLSGQVVTGLGQGATFTQLEWARQQFITQLGIDPYPGTLNLRLTGAAELAAWLNLKAQPGLRIVPPDSAWCQARGYPVRVAGRLPGAIICPEIPAYPEAQVEIIAALSLREVLSLQDRDVVPLEVAQPLPVRAVVFDVDGTLVDTFEVIITGAQVSRPKPDPEGLLRCAAALGVKPEEAVYVGDTPVDVQTSRAAGTAAVSVLSGAGDSALLSAAAPDWLIYSHTQLPDILRSGP
jgi:hypothetical protein